MARVVVDLHEDLLALFGSEEEARRQLTEAGMLRLVRERKIGPSQGAALLRMHLSDFVRLMASEGIPYFEYGAEELRKDVKVACEAAGWDLLPRAGPTNT
jgi:predicted HTH domain antitoxin